MAAGTVGAGTGGRAAVAGRYSSKYARRGSRCTLTESSRRFSDWSRKLTESDEAT